MLATQERKEMCFKRNIGLLFEEQPESASVEEGLLSEAAGYVCIVYRATICIDIYIYGFLQCWGPLSVELLDLGFLDFRASLAAVVPLWVLWGKSGNRNSQRHTTAPKCKSYLKHPHARDREPHIYNT